MWQLLDEPDGIRQQYFGELGGCMGRTVVSSVAKSLSATRTSLPVIARIRDDLPHLCSQQGLQSSRYLFDGGERRSLVVR